MSKIYMSGYTGIQTRPIITGGAVVTSVTMNFESTRVAIGDTVGNGTVRVYDYDIGTNIWSAVGSPLTGPSSGSGFGQSIDMDWSGTRMVVGANTVSQVYVYDYGGVNWTSTTIFNSPSGVGSDFGFSVSISKDIADTIAVGAPLHNNVHVYTIVDSLWDLSFSNIGTDIENIAPIDTSGTNNYVLKPEFNRYGECVRLSSLGEYLIVGQPGTILGELNSTNTIGLTGTVDVSSKQEISGVYPDTFGDNLNRQQGSARVFKTDDAWHLSNRQIGSLMMPDIENTTSNTARTAFSLGWSFPGFGMQVDISSDGDIVVVSAPLYSVLGGDYTYHNGQLYTFILVDGEWVKKDVVTGLKRVLYGSSVKLDYTGNRISLTGTNKVCSLLNVSDWNGNNWFNAQPDIIEDGDDIHNVTYITNGSVAPIARDTTIFFYDYLLTQSILGNNLVSGYLAADELFIGANDNDNGASQKFSKTKRISFGGTYLDNTYEGATIENRMYKPYSTLPGFTGQGNEGRSELYIAKTSEPISVSSSGGVDFIRFKAHEIHLDSYPIYDPNGGFNNKYDQDPSFVLNYQKNIGIGLPFLENLSGTGDYFRGTCNAQAKLDVNGSTYIRNRLNINRNGGNDILGNIGEQPNLFFDTRNESSFVDGRLYSNTLVNHEIINTATEAASSFTYSSTERAIFIGPGDYVVTYLNAVGSSSFIKASFWFKVTQIPASDRVVFRYGDPINNTLAHRVILTSTGIQVSYFSQYTATYNLAINIDEWYHIYLVFPDNRSTGDFSTSVFINSIAVTPTSTTGSLPTDWSVDGSRFVTLSDVSNGLLNTYIGMIMVWSTHSDRAPNATQVYNNGPPSEMLKVGGDSVFMGKVGVGLTNPTEALEVSGNVHANYFVGDGSGLSHITLQSVTDYGNVTSNTVQFTNTGTSLVTSGNVGIGTTSPSTRLDIQTPTGTSSNMIRVHSALSSGTSRSYSGLRLIGNPVFNNGDNGPRTGCEIRGGFKDVGQNNANWNNGFCSIFVTQNTGGALIETLTCTNGGSVGILTNNPMYTLDVNGTIRASGDVIAFSDGRYKTDVRRIDGALEKVDRVSGYTFRMKDGTERRAGVIAQEIREVLPEVVVGTEESGYNVAYGNMAGLFIEAIKELKGRVETLEAALRATISEGLSSE